VSALTVASILFGDSGESDIAAAERPEPTDKVAPLPWEGEKPPMYEPEPPPFITAKKHGIENMPPASAGSNGSYKPRPAAEREKYRVDSHPEGAASPEQAAYVVGDVAIPPPGAPPEIQAAITA
jgi:hypothetical protein